MKAINTIKVNSFSFANKHRACNKRISIFVNDDPPFINVVYDPPLLAPDAPNLYLEYQDERSKLFTIRIKMDGLLSITFNFYQVKWIV